MLISRRNVAIVLSAMDCPLKDHVYRYPVYAPPHL